jgi:hypothetical protein
MLQKGKMGNRLNKKKSKKRKSKTRRRFDNKKKTNKFIQVRIFINIIQY